MFILPRERGCVEDQPQHRASLDGPKNPSRVGAAAGLRHSRAPMRLFRNLIAP